MILLLSGDEGTGVGPVSTALRKGVRGAVVVEPGRLAELARMLDPAGATTADHRDLPMWRQLVVAAVRDTRAARRTAPLLLPVEGCSLTAHEELVSGLRAVDDDVRPVTLVTDDGGPWQGLPVATDGRSRAEVVTHVQRHALQPGPGRRLARVAQLLEHVRSWAADQPDVRSVALVGSWARGTPRPDSDVDLVVVVDEVPARLRDEGWMAQLGPVETWRDEDWGLVQARRVVFSDGLEAEVGLTTRAWTRVPADPGTRAVLADGGVVVHDPDGALAAALTHARSALRA